MGQYYEILAEDKDGKRTVYDRSVGEEYTLAKLMEHSWWHNSFCCALGATLVDNPRRIAWVGDYSDMDMEGKDLGFKFEDVWGDEVEGHGIDKTKFSLDDVKYLVNNSKRQYVDLAKYKERHLDAFGDGSGYVIHPVPLLTCIGNGHGGGDYWPKDEEAAKYVGVWVFDEIYLTSTLPEGYEEICPVFREGE